MKELQTRGEAQQIENKQGGKVVVEHVDDREIWWRRIFEKID